MIRARGSEIKLRAAHVGRGPYPLPAGRAACRRCGIVRVVNESREVGPLCQDCADVEADLAAEAIQRDVCGTLTGYTYHRRNNEPKCGDCRAAMSEYRRARRAMGRAA